MGYFYFDKLSQKIKGLRKIGKEPRDEETNNIVENCVQSLIRKNIPKNNLDKMKPGDFYFSYKNIICIDGKEYYLKLKKEKEEEYFCFLIERIEENLQKISNKLESRQLEESQKFCLIKLIERSGFYKKL